jgi:hypothetical protein
MCTLTLSMFFATTDMASFFRVCVEEPNGLADMSLPESRDPQTYCCYLVQPGLVVD